MIPFGRDTLREGVSLFKVAAGEPAIGTIYPLVEGDVNALVMGVLAERGRACRLHAGIVNQVIKRRLSRPFFPGVKKVPKVVDHIDQDNRK